jgi:hypothetical protein
MCSTILEIEVSLELLKRNLVTIRQYNPILVYCMYLPYDITQTMKCNNKHYASSNYFDKLTSAGTNVGRDIE